MKYTRLNTREVKIGNILVGNGHPIRIQTMTTTDTMDTEATVAQSIRCIEAGAEGIRITAPSKNEAENLLHIKNALRAKGYHTPLVADIHFTPNAAEIAARIVEKVRINPGNYVDKKRFDLIEYTDEEYAGEIDRIRERFTPLVRICKEYGTAMRIGVNHGSLSDRIMSRYGDTPMGMVESALEFLRITRGENYHQVVLSMKSSNPIVMVQAYRLLVFKMSEEFGECYPLHLGVTEAGDGIDGRVKSAIGIGTLLEEGIGDTIRVSLTEDPEFEIPVCKDIVDRYANGLSVSAPLQLPVPPSYPSLPYNPFAYKRRETIAVQNIGGSHVPVVVADFTMKNHIDKADLEAIGYKYNQESDKWNISDSAADYIYTYDKILDFPLPGTLQVICRYDTWLDAPDKTKYHPKYNRNEYMDKPIDTSFLHFVGCDSAMEKSERSELFGKLKDDKNAVILLMTFSKEAQQYARSFYIEMMANDVHNPVITTGIHMTISIDGQLISNAIDTGSLLLDGLGDGIYLLNCTPVVYNPIIPGRTRLEVKSAHQFLNDTAFTVLQATRTRISKTEYISCPSCGRTLFDLQETTAKIRAATHHLKGVKIAIMGCIVNGPGEMADADFGYVGSGPGKITLYKGKDIIKRNVPSEIAVTKLIELLKENEAWVEQIVL